MKCLRLQLDSCLGSRIRRPNTPPSKNAPDATPAPVLLKISWPSQLHQLATQSSKQTTEGTERGTHLRRANEAGAPAPVPNPPPPQVPVLRLRCPSGCASECPSGRASGCPSSRLLQVAVRRLLRVVARLRLRLRVATTPPSGAVRNK